MIVNVPSLANSDWLSLREDLDEMVGAGIQAIHIDIADGHYVPSLFFPIGIVESIKASYPELVLDAHCMVERPEQYIDQLAATNCDWMSFPLDATRFARRTIGQIQAAGMKAGVALNPSAPVATVSPVVDIADYVVLMTVEPGFAGQSLLPGSLDRIEELRSLLDGANSDAFIEIDGGVSFGNAPDMVDRGASALVSGIYSTYDPVLGLAAGVAEFARRLQDRGHGLSFD